MTCLLYGFVDYSGKGTKKLTCSVTGYGEVEVRMATYGPGVDQSQDAKSVSHITKELVQLLVFSTTF